MKLARFAVNSGPPELGAVKGDRVIPLRGSLDTAAETMEGLIQSWGNIGSHVERLVALEEQSYSLMDVELLAPVARPGKIMAIGLNYADHIAEAGLDRPEDQVWFCKQPTAVHAPFAPIELPSTSTEIDYEVELVVVIGKGGRRISRSAAPDHVFGYCVGNDVTARDWQKRTAQWVVSKSFDTHAPFGPWITTADEVGDPHRLNIRCSVNSDIRQNSNTRELIYDVYDQISYLSQAMTLEPGDLIFTGTPGGVGAAMNPPVFLQNGDRVRCEIDSLGALDAVFQKYRQY